MNNQLRIYPIRNTRKKWNINLYKYHTCSEDCNKRLIADSDELILTDNPNYINGVCEKYNKLEKTFLRLVSFREDGTFGEGDRLYGIDDTVIPDKSFVILVYYPLSFVLEVVINSETTKGYTLLEIINSIKTVYEYIYEEEEQTATPQVYELKKICYTCGKKDLLKYVDYFAFDSESKTDNENECSICYNTYEIGSNVAKLKCNHNFHSSCIEEWFKTSGTCPICRNNVFECVNCDGSGIIYYQFTGTVIPIEERGMNLNRNPTNGVFGIYDCDLENLFIESLSYNRVKKKLYINMVSLQINY